MDKLENTTTVYKFRNTCYKCWNDIEFPLLSDFTYGEVIFQTKDAQDFYVAVLIDNKTFDFITDFLQDKKRLKKADPQKILAQIADKVNNQEFTTHFPICPVCKARKRYFTDNIRTTKIELGYATWTDFESLSQENKLRRLRGVLDL